MPTVLPPHAAFKCVCSVDRQYQWDVSRLLSFLVVTSQYSPHYQLILNWPWSTSIAAVNLLWVGWLFGWHGQFSPGVAASKAQMPGQLALAHGHGPLCSATQVPIIHQRSWITKRLVKDLLVHRWAPPVNYNWMKISPLPNFEPWLTMVNNGYIVVLSGSISHWTIVYDSFICHNC